MSKGYGVGITRAQFSEIHKRAKQQGIVGTGKDGLYTAMDIRALAWCWGYVATEKLSTEEITEILHQLRALGIHPFFTKHFRDSVMQFLALLTKKELIQHILAECPNLSNSKIAELVAEMKGEATTANYVRKVRYLLKCEQGVTA